MGLGVAAINGYDVLKPMAKHELRKAYVPWQDSIIFALAMADAQASRPLNISSLIYLRLCVLSVMLKATRGKRVARAVFPGSALDG